MISENPEVDGEIFVLRKWFSTRCANKFKKHVYCGLASLSYLGEHFTIQIRTMTDSTSCEQKLHLDNAVVYALRSILNIVVDVWPTE